jgi:hypothetical protein
VPSIKTDEWADSPSYLLGIALFNAGYYWEAHEAWEALWLAHGRRGPVAAVLQALIKLSAAGVKVREGRPAGVRSHAAGAGQLFAESRGQGGRYRLGLDLDEWINRCRAIANHPPQDHAAPSSPVSVVFDFLIEPRPQSDHALPQPSSEPPAPSK